MKPWFLYHENQWFWCFSTLAPHRKLGVGSFQKLFGSLKDWKLLQQIPIQNSFYIGICRFLRQLYRKIGVFFLKQKVCLCALICDFTTCCFPPKMCLMILSWESENNVKRKFGYLRVGKRAKTVLARFFSTELERLLWQKHFFQWKKSPPLLFAQI